MMFFLRIPLFAAAVLACAPAARADLRVDLEGLGKAERENVEQRLAIHRYAEQDGADDAQVRRLHRQAEDEIRDALQAFGYYSPQIRGSLNADGTDWIARYEVEPGPPTLLDEVHLDITGEGHDFPALVEARSKSELRTGERVLHARYEATKTALARAAYDNGFLDARFTAHLLRIEPLRRRAVAVIEIDTGPRYYFGEVSVAQEGLDPAFVARYVPIRPGEPFEPEKLLQAQFALSDLGYFASVDVQPRRDQAVGQHVPVTIATTKRPPQRYDASIGYGTDTGARLKLGAEFRQLTDTGHKLRNDLLVSEVKNSINFDYRIPLGTRAGENLGFGTGYTDEKIADGESKRYNFTVSLSRAMGDWQRQVYLKHEYEESFVPATGTDSTKLLMPGLALSRGELDNPIHARYGWSVFLDGHAGTEAVVSDVTFGQGKALLRGVLPLGERGRLLGRAELGGTLIDEFRELPASQRFYAGGDQSVRGYAYQSLGPKDAAGKIVGGKYLTTYSGEAEYLPWRNWGFAVFLDAGNASDDPWPELVFGVGIGVRYRAPVGTVQVDLAHPLDGDDRGIRPHLGIRVGL